MNRWVSRIALVAYLVGGWLLPAMHRHEHGAHVEGGTHVAAHCSHEHQPVSASHCCGHKTDEVDDDASTSRESNPSPEQHRWVAGQQLSACSGLCALCSARTLRSHTVALRNAHVQVVPAADLVACDNRRHAPSQFLSSISSRGPPAVL